MTVSVDDTREEYKKLLRENGVKEISKVHGYDEVGAGPVYYYWVEEERKDIKFLWFTRTVTEETTIANVDNSPLCPNVGGYSHQIRVRVSAKHKDRVIKIAEELDKAGFNAGVKVI